MSASAGRGEGEGPARLVRTFASWGPAKGRGGYLTAIPSPPKTFIDLIAGPIVPDDQRGIGGLPHRRERPTPPHVRLRRGHLCRAQFHPPPPPGRPCGADTPGPARAAEGGA